MTPRQTWKPGIGSRRAVSSPPTRGSGRIHLAKGVSWRWVIVADGAFKPQKEINRIKNQLKGLEKQKEKSFPDLGRATLQAFLEGRLQDDALSLECQRLKDIDAQIAQGHSEMEQLKAQAARMKASPAAAVGTCVSCGSPLMPGMRFCGGCGQEFVPPAPAASDACPQCGAALQPGAKFCGECGIPAAVAPPTAPAAPTQGAQAAPPPPPPASPPTIISSKAKCSSCGAEVDESDAAFCGECGGRLMP